MLQALMLFLKSSRIRAISIVQPALTCADFPFGASKLFSVDTEGHVVSPPLPSSISHARQNSAADFIVGYAICLRYSLSPVKTKCSQRCSQNHGALIAKLAHVGSANGKPIPTGADWRHRSAL